MSAWGVPERQSDSLRVHDDNALNANRWTPIGQSAPVVAPSVAVSPSTKPSRLGMYVGGSIVGAALVTAAVVTTVFLVRHYKDKKKE